MGQTRRVAIGAVEGESPVFALNDACGLYMEFVYGGCIGQALDLEVWVYDTTLLAWERNLGKEK